ncbi:MurR/RpiR family transcriptional regulator [Enterococcus songbeiensis]|uniref:MurR/RpiR family transcriptional regulator n=1 Tax=Enterococcus songbeiensis TaxID=2559927 RepID=UPI0010FA41D7|nr:MurR/RpiR family transcriptional regulator [Enterococcus songbeiensis]
MLVSEKIKQTDFSTAESAVITYILNHSENLADKTIKEIAQATFVHPSTLIRIAKKLGFTGWIELRDVYLTEQNYLQQHFTKVDANLPFSATDGLLTIANKLAVLEKTTIDDTLSLLTHDELQQAKQFLLKATTIKIFASNANTLISQDFALKMKRIKKEVSIVTTFGEAAYEAYNCSSDTCAILISYTGENQMTLQIADLLKKNHVPIIALTSIGNNSLTKISDTALHLTTRERLYSKIGNFTINTSICYLLDVLYSCIFAENYQQNLQHLVQIGQAIDKRPISSTVMQEKPLDSLIHDSFLPN